MSQIFQQSIIEDRQQIYEISVDDADEAIVAADVILDVREPIEYETGYIPGAINIPRAMLAYQLGKIPQLKSLQAHIIIYCKTGARCILAAQALEKMGYEHVLSITGGINAWIQAGKRVQIK